MDLGGDLLSDYEIFFIKDYKHDIKEITNILDTNECVYKLVPDALDNEQSLLIHNRYMQGIKDIKDLPDWFLKKIVENEKSRQEESDDRKLAIHATCEVVDDSLHSDCEELSTNENWSAHDDKITVKKKTIHSLIEMQSNNNKYFEKSFDELLLVNEKHAALEKIVINLKNSYDFIFREIQEVKDKQLSISDQLFRLTNNYGQLANVIIYSDENGVGVPEKERGDVTAATLRINEIKQQYGSIKKSIKDIKTGFSHKLSLLHSLDDDRYVQKSQLNSLLADLKKTYENMISIQKTLIDALELCYFFCNKETCNIFNNATIFGFKKYIY